MSHVTTQRYTWIRTLHLHILHITPRWSCCISTWPIRQRSGGISWNSQAHAVLRPVSWLLWKHPPLLRNISDIRMGYWLANLPFVHLLLPGYSWVSERSCLFQWTTLIVLSSLALLQHQPRTWVWEPHQKSWKDVGTLARFSNWRRPAAAESSS